MMLTIDCAYFPLFLMLFLLPDSLLCMRMFWFLRLSRFLLHFSVFIFTRKSFPFMFEKFLLNLLLKIKSTKIIGEQTLANFDSNNYRNNIEICLKQDSKRNYSTHTYNMLMRSITTNERNIEIDNRSQPARRLVSNEIKDRKRFAILYCRLWKMCFFTFVIWPCAWLCLCAIIEDNEIHNKITQTSDQQWNENSFSWFSSLYFCRTETKIW